MVAFIVQVAIATPLHDNAWLATTQQCCIWNSGFDYADASPGHSCRFFKRNQFLVSTATKLTNSMIRTSSDQIQWFFFSGDSPTEVKNSRERSLSQLCQWWVRKVSLRVNQVSEQSDDDSLMAHLPTGSWTSNEQLRVNARTEQTDSRARRLAPT